MRGFDGKMPQFFLKAKSTTTLLESFCFYCFLKRGNKCKHVNPTSVGAAEAVGVGASATLSTTGRLALNSFILLK